MCCIVACKSKRLDFDTLVKINRSNPDGLGIAWIEKDRVHWRKGMSLQKAAKLCLRLPMPYVLHARLATVGGAGFSLAHPFPIEPVPRTSHTGSAVSVLFHNGHVSEWKALLHVVDPNYSPNYEKWSDSRALAHIIARNQSKKIFNHLQGNKFAILSPKNGIEKFGTWADDKDAIAFSSHVNLAHWSGCYGNFSETADDIIDDMIRHEKRKNWEPVLEKFRIKGGKKYDENEPYAGGAKEDTFVD